MKELKIISKKLGKRRRNKIVPLAKNKLNGMKFKISKVLIDSYISRDEFALVNYALREYDYMK